MISLLEAAHEFVGENKFKGIRISTRPDYITPEILDILKKYGVTAIELGAQSMNDEVLAANERGHTAQDVINASELIKKYGFELGLQMMTGLYKSSLERDYFTAKSIIALAPDTVRIYPVVVLKGTKLEKIFADGKERYNSFETMVEHCADLIKLFHNEGIRVIKCGLHASEFVEKDMVGGYYHPAFRELCENSVYRDSIEYALRDSGITGGDATIVVNDKCISKAIGQKKSNINYFKEQGINIKIVGSPNMPVYDADAKR
jgi:histone acetyltransferase (RNA polymerase elongator complex component)